MASTKPSKPKPAVAVSFATLTDLLGKVPDDPAVTAALATAGKITMKTEFLIAKEAGFDFALDRPAGVRHRILTTLFLYTDGQDGHRGFADLPPGFAWGTRVDLLAKRPTPKTTWKIGPGRVDVSTIDATWDQWDVGELTITVTYTKGALRHINVKRPAPAA